MSGLEDWTGLQRVRGATRPWGRHRQPPPPRPGADDGRSPPQPQRVRPERRASGEAPVKGRRTVQWLDAGSMLVCDQVTGDSVSPHIIRVPVPSWRVVVRMGCDPRNLGLSKASLP